MDERGDGGVGGSAFSSQRVDIHNFKTRSPASNGGAFLGACHRHEKIRWGHQRVQY